MFFLVWPRAGHLRINDTVGVIRRFLIYYIYRFGHPFDTQVHSLNALTNCGPLRFAIFPIVSRPLFLSDEEPGVQGFTTVVPMLK